MTPSEGVLRGSLKSAEAHGVEFVLLGHTVGHTMYVQGVLAVHTSGIDKTHHTETGRNPDRTRLTIYGTVLKSENNTVQQYDLQNRRLVLFNLGTWGTEVPLSLEVHASVYPVS